MLCELFVNSEFVCFFVFFYQIFTGQGADRPDVKDILILFTDGNAHDLPVAREQAKRMKERNITLVTIGAGKDDSLMKFKKELEEMASGPEYSMTVNFDELEVFAQKAFPLVCRYLRRL